MKSGIFHGRETGGTSTSSSPNHIGKYEIVAEIGATKQSRVRVYRALDRALSRPVVLKLVADVNDTRLADRFRHEVRSIAQLRVPNLIAIHDLAEHEGMPFAAMQDLGENSLERLIRSRKDPPLFQKVLLMEQVAAGAAEAHRAGLAHIGLHPAGIAVAGDGVAIIQDFGTVRLSGGKQTRTGYEAPEQGANFVPDLLCDVFAFGLICYELLTGAHPFRDGDSPNCDWQRAPVALRQLLPQCPDPLDPLLSRLLEKRRELRHPSFEGIRDELRPILQILRRSRATQLRSDSQRLIDEEHLEEAQGAVREALQLDPDDTHTQQISNDLHTLLHQRKTRSRLAELWRQADEAAGNRRFFAAVDILESAARLAGEDAETRARLDGMRTRLGQSVDANQLIGEAQQLVDQGELDQARAKAAKALERDPENPEARELLKSISEMAGRREKQARIDKGIAQAKSLALECSFEEALALLNRLQAEHPDSALLRQWITHVEDNQRAAERQERLRTLTTSAQSLVGQQRFSEAVSSLAPAIREFPDDPALSNLLLQARQGLDRIRTLQQTTTRCNQLCQQQQFEQALHAVDGVLASTPGQPELLALRQTIEAQAQKHRRAASVREALEEVDWLLDQDRPDLAIRFLKQQHLAIADEPKVAARLQDLEAQLPDWEIRHFLDLVEEFAARPMPAGVQPDLGTVLLPVLEEMMPVGMPGSGTTETAERLRSALREQAIVARVRHYLAGGDADRAQEIFESGMQFLHGEASITSVKQQIEAYRKYAGERQTAAVLLGRRQLNEAEQLLLRLAKPDRPEIQELLELVRELRSGSNETGFHARVKETALMLARQGKREEADRLFRRLAVLFPGAGVLEDERVTAASSAPTGAAPQKPSAQEREEPATSRPDAIAWWKNIRRPKLKHGSPAPKVAVISGALILTAAGGAVWKSSRERVPAPAEQALHAARESQPAARADAGTNPAAPDGLPSQEARLSNQIVVSTRTASVTRRKEVREAEPVAPRPFQAPAERLPGADRAQNIDLPAPPVPGAGFSRETPGTLAIGQPQVNIPLPQSKADSHAAEKPAETTHPRVVEPARLLTAPVPQFPVLAARNHVSGVVEMDAVVDKQGHVKGVTAVRGNPLLTAAARQAVRGWRYQPASIDGEPVEAQVQITMRFAEPGR